MTHQEFFTTSREQMEALCRTYRSSEQIDLVLGAGVSLASGIPLYLELSLRLARRAADRNLIPHAPPAAVAYLKEQLDYLERGGADIVASRIRPEEVILFVKAYLPDKGLETLPELLEQTLYDDGKTIKTLKRKLVSRRTYKENLTLHSIMRFCAASGGSALAPSSEHSIEPNPKIRAILTTNYDNLLEASFSTKYRYLLKPVARADSSEARPGQELIPVYHIHGYVNVFPPSKKARKRKPGELVSAEDDYFRTFYNPSGFTDETAKSFFRDRPCLFIGSAMTDMNLRRFLFYAGQERAEGEAMPRHFAIMKSTGDAKDDFDAAVLGAYGVDIVWVDGFDRIENVLKEVYISAKDVEAADWEALRAYERTG